MANDSKKYVSLSRLQTFLENLTNKFAALSHKHTMSDITDISDIKVEVDTELSSTSNNPVANSALNAEFDVISNAMGALELSIDGKADSSHNHNDVYYTESEIDTKIDDLHEELDTVREELDIGKDWNQNDSTKPDFIKNRPFYEHDPVDFKIAEGTVQAGEMLQTAANVESMTLGETYTVIFDGVTYSDLVCVDIGGVAGVGSVDMSLTDYPFAFVVQAGMAMAMVVSDNKSHTIAVIGKVSEIVPLERKYIAEHIDMFAGEKATGKVYTIDGVEVTAGKGAEVFNDYSTNIASGQYSHAEGMSNTASGMISHAEGWDTKASGSYSHTEGSETTASGEQSHAEGWLTEATNDAAHAEGFATNATGKYAHAEGDNATASGRAAHAEGYSSEAIGDYSHAEGLNTKASSNNQHVQGKYNIEDANDKYAHIIGNGSSNSSRSNAHTVDWNGNGWFKADVYVGGTSQDDGEKLATKTYVDDTIASKAGTDEILPRRLKTYNDVALTDPNLATETGFHHVSGATNRPPFSQNENLGYRVLTTANTVNWLQQIATDFRCDDVFYRRRIDGVWTAWQKIVMSNSTGTFAGQVVANASATSAIGTAQVRNIRAGTADLVAGSSTLATGELYFVYE